MYVGTYNALHGYLQVKLMQYQGNTVAEVFCEYTSINLDRKYAEMVACDNHCHTTGEAHNRLNYSYVHTINRTIPVHHLPIPKQSSNIKAYRDHWQLFCFIVGLISVHVATSLQEK